jgi:hypothetical protein
LLNRGCASGKLLQLKRIIAFRSEDDLDPPRPVPRDENDVARH